MINIIGGLADPEVIHVGLREPVVAGLVERRVGQSR
jgi:hypothetical protein